MADGAERRLLTDEMVRHCDALAREPGGSVNAYFYLLKLGVNGGGRLGVVVPGPERARAEVPRGVARPTRRRGEGATDNEPFGADRIAALETPGERNLARTMAVMEKVAEQQRRREQGEVAYLSFQYQVAGVTFEVNYYPIGSRVRPVGKLVVQRYGGRGIGFDVNFECEWDGRRGEMNFTLGESGTKGLMTDMVEKIARGPRVITVGYGCMESSIQPWPGVEGWED